MKDITEVTSDILKFDNQFTVELWVRFSEANITKIPYYLFQKNNTNGVNTVMFQFYFTPYPEHAFVVEFN